MQPQGPLQMLHAIRKILHQKILHSKTPPIHQTMKHQLKAEVISCAQGAGLAPAGQLAGDQSTAPNAAVPPATIAWYGTPGFTRESSVNDETKEDT